MTKRKTKPKRDSGWVGYDPPISSRRGMKLLMPLMDTRECGICKRPITYGAQRRFVRLKNKINPVVICYDCAERRANDKSEEDSR